MNKSNFTDFLIIYGPLAFLGAGLYGLYHMKTIEDNFQEERKNRLLIIAKTKKPTSHISYVENTGRKSVNISNYPFLRLNGYREAVFKTYTIFKVNGNAWLAFEDELDIQDVDPIYNVSMAIPDTLNRDIKTFCIEPEKPRQKTCFFAVPI